MQYNDIRLNDVMTNQAMCVPIDSVDDKCHAALGDGRKAYKDQGRLIVERPDGLYFVPDCDEFGGWQGGTDWSRFVQLMAIFYPNYKPLRELPEITENI